MALLADHMDSSGEYRKDITVFLNSCYLTESMWCGPQCEADHLVSLQQVHLLHQKSKESQEER
jgi:hypothetical protein